MEDLEDEEVDGGDGVEQPLAPGVLLLVTGELDGIGGQVVGEVLPESIQDGDNTRRQHGRAPSGVSVGESNH